MYEPKREPVPDADERLGRWILGGVVLIAVAVGVWLWQRNRNSDETPPVVEQPVAAATPAIKNPIETPAGTDASLSAADETAKLVGAEKFQAMFVPDDFVRKAVATVDNLARPKIATRMNPAKPPAGTFATAGDTEVVLGAANYARYASWVEMVDALDPDATVELYRRLYPQLQAAYENLGNPDGYFNDRVIEVLDHLIATPVAPDTIVLTRPKVLYEFADPALEAESAGRKLLFRMGPGNAARVKMKLRDIRDRIAS